MTVHSSTQSQRTHFENLLKRAYLEIVDLRKLRDRQSKQIKSLKTAIMDSLGSTSKVASMISCSASLLESTLKNPIKDITNLSTTPQRNMFTRTMPSNQAMQQATTDLFELDTTNKESQPNPQIVSREDIGMVDDGLVRQLQEQLNDCKATIRSLKQKNQLQEASFTNKIEILKIENNEIKKKLVDISKIPALSKKSSAEVYFTPSSQADKDGYINKLKQMLIEEKEKCRFIESYYSNSENLSVDTRQIDAEPQEKVEFSLKQMRRDRDRLAHENNSMQNDIEELEKEKNEKIELLEELNEQQAIREGNFVPHFPLYFY